MSVTAAARPPLVCRTSTVDVTPTSSASGRSDCDRRSRQRRATDAGLRRGRAALGGQQQVGQHIVHHRRHCAAVRRSSPRSARHAPGVAAGSGCGSSRRSAACAARGWHPTTKLRCSRSASASGRTERRAASQATRASEQHAEESEHDHPRQDLSTSTTKSSPDPCVLEPAAVLRALRAAIEQDDREQDRRPRRDDDRRRHGDPQADRQSPPAAPGAGRPASLMSGSPTR